MAYVEVDNAATQKAIKRESIGDCFDGYALCRHSEQSGHIKATGVPWRLMDL
jgi:hypothetical protein